MLCVCSCALLCMIFLKCNFSNSIISTAIFFTFLAAIKLTCNECNEISKSKSAHAISLKIKFFVFVLKTFSLVNPAENANSNYFFETQ